MCFFARGRWFALLIAAAVPLQIPRLSAQEPPADPAAIERDTLPDAPQPQQMPASVAGSAAWPDLIQPRISSEEDEERRKAQHSPAPDASGASISGTVTNANGEVVPAAIVVLEGPLPEDRRSVVSSDRGAFHFEGLRAGVPYAVIVEARDLESWKSEAIVLEPGQFYFLKDIRLKIPPLVTAVMVYADREQIATEQVTVELKQRVFGFIPNFYVTYDPEPVPLTTGLKFKLALKADTDVMTFVGIAFMAGIYQAGDLPDYGQGAQGFAKRMGAGYADTTSNIFLGGAILPWAFRQDPRYFYQGTGTKKSRALHAISSPFICKGDNGKTQPNYSSLLGDLGSGALSNLYYPESNRGAKLLFGGFLITTGVRTVKGLVQEFLLRSLTPSARAQF